jgi:microcystin-dependent protein
MNNIKYHGVRPTAFSLLLLCLVGLVPSAHAQVTVPNGFTNGTPGNADEVNENFNALADAINNVPTGGAQGDPGPEGPAGPPGATGPQGPAGTGLDATGTPAAGDILSWDDGGGNWVATPPTVAVAGVDNMQPFLTVNYIIALQGIFPSRNNFTDPTLGEIAMFAGNFAPLKWAFCNGQVLSINQNQSLFSILGTTYGGDGRTTFALPDLRGRVPVHSGGEAGPGLTLRSIGQRGGSETH